jgi:hypothetical protein
MNTTAVVSYRGAAITLQRPTVRTRLKEDVIAARLNVAQIADPAERYFTLAFASFAALVVSIDGDPGFSIPEFSAPAEDWAAARDAWLAADAGLLRAIDETIARLIAPPGDVELSPLADEGQKKDGPKTGRSSRGSVTD